MQPAKLSRIRYTKDDGYTDRVVIPTDVPKSNMKALDVTEQTASERERLQELVAEYNQYREGVINTIFSFEDWLDLVQAEHDELKWRTFRMRNVEDLS